MYSFAVKTVCPTLPLFSRNSHKYTISTPKWLQVAISHWNSHIFTKSSDSIRGSYFFAVPDLEPTHFNFLSGLITLYAEEVMRMQTKRYFSLLRGLELPTPTFRGGFGRIFSSESRLFLFSKKIFSGMSFKAKDDSATHEKSFALHFWAKLFKNNAPYYPF